MNFGLGIPQASCSLGQCLNYIYIYIYICIYLARSDVKGKRMSKKATLRGKGDVRGK